MFYRKIGTGPPVVAVPLAHVVVCDEDEESPQAPTLATWQSTAVWVTLLVLLLLGVSPKHFFYYCVPNGLGELAVYFVVLFWALMVALLCRPTSDARRPEKDGGVDLDRGQPPVAVEVDRVVGALDDLLERLRPRDPVLLLVDLLALGLALGLLGVALGRRRARRRGGARGVLAELVPEHALHARAVAVLMLRSALLLALGRREQLHG